MFIDFLPLFNGETSVCEINKLNPAVLAFIGDGVQTLFVRSQLAFRYFQKTGSLHRMTASYISAVNQAEALKKILPILTEEETDIFKRVRNCKTHTQAKNASIVDYKVASGFEGLIGYLYLSNRHERLLTLLNTAYEEKL